MLIEATVYCHSMLRQYLFNDNSTLNVIVITDMELIITYINTVNSPFIHRYNTGTITWLLSRIYVIDVI